MLKPIKLTGEQKKVLFLPEREPIQIKGVAGSGKTTVALYRAKHLVDTYRNLFQEPNVAIFTYNKSLVKYINSLLPVVIGGYQKESDIILDKPKGLNVQVFTFHSYAYKFLQSNGFWRTHNVIQKKEKTELIEKTVLEHKLKNSTAKILSKKVAFFEDEFSWIKGKMFDSKDEYLNAQRSGRGVQDKVTKSDRELIWNCYESYQNKLNNLKQIDFDDFAIYALNYRKSLKSFNPPFSHLVIDEAQDLSKSQITFMKELVYKSTNSLTLIADTAQRIYKSGFSWAEVGINVVGGRTTVLKKNYRNTKEIAVASLSLLDKENDKSDFTDADTSAFIKTGDKPMVAFFNSYQGQNNYLVSELKKIDLKKYSVVVLHRCRNSLYRIFKLLESNKIPAEVIGQDFENFSSETVKICTLPSIKGLEFDYVFVVDLNEDTIPLPTGITGEDDDFHISTERRLLYTSMTRAKEKLYLISSGKPSIFVSELAENLIVIKGSNQTLLIDELPF